LPQEDYFKKLAESVYDSWARHQLELVPQGREQTREDMEQLAVFFATLPKMTGQCVNVDGAWYRIEPSCPLDSSGEPVFSRGPAPGLALGLRNAFTAVTASSTASIRGSGITRATQSHQPHQHI